MNRSPLPPCDGVSLVVRDRAVRAAFQPILDLTTGTVAGYEALARFPDAPEYEVSSWFQSAHRCGLGTPLEAEALRAALCMRGRPRGTFLSLNISPAAFVSSLVQSCLPESLEGLVIEITEDQLIEAEDPVHEAISIARARGARIAVDDVGTGHAGFSQLMRVMPEVIKLDRSLIANVSEELARAALVESLVHYGQRTHTMVCAEGIESRDELALMVELGVTYGQGFAIARPSHTWPAPSKLAVETCTGDSPPSADSTGGEEAAAGLELLTSALARASTRDDLNSAAERIASALGADEVYISRLVADQRCLEVIAGFGGPGVGLCYRLTDYPATAGVLAERRPEQVLVSDPKADPGEVRLLLAQGVKSMLMLPISDGGQSVGLLELYRRTERAWDEGTGAAARATSTQLAAVMDRLRRLDRLGGAGSLVFDSTPLPELVRRRVGL